LSQVQSLLLFSIGDDAIAYFCILPGAINSVTSLRATKEESGVSDVFLVADTGIYSSKNVKDLDGMGIFFIVPLKRNSKMIDYSMEQGRHFMFQGHSIFYSRYQSNGRPVFSYLNYLLKAEEEKNYLRRHEKGFAAFRNISGRMGTILVINHLKSSREIVYQILKSRDGIEQCYDIFKNTIHADPTYMRDDYQLQEWMLVNFIALILHLRICRILKVKDMLKIGEEWKISEIPKKSRDIIDELGVHIMQKNES
jgi:transposase